GIRGSEEAIMTKNEYDLKNEVNMSSGTNYIDNNMSNQPKRDKLIASHKIYLMKNSNKYRTHNEKTTAHFNAYNLNTAAFITSQVGELGPWPVQTGLCSLEEHRHLPIESQVTHYKMLGTFDDLIIGNGYASEDELKKA